MSRTGNIPRAASTYVAMFMRCISIVTSLLLLLLLLLVRNTLSPAEDTFLVGLNISDRFWG